MKTNNPTKYDISIIIMCYSSTSLQNLFAFHNGMFN